MIWSKIEFAQKRAVTRLQYYILPKLFVSETESVCLPGRHDFPLCVHFIHVLQTSNKNVSFKLGIPGCTLLATRQSVWLWTDRLLAEMKSFAQRKFGWHDRIPRTRLISPNRLMGLSYNATATRIRYLVLYGIYGRSSFYSLRTLCPDKGRYCVLLGI